MVNSEDFAKRLQELMDFYSLTSSGLADAIDFNRSSISHLLSGRNKPSLEFVMKILETFPEVKLYWLLNGKGSFPEIENKNDEKSPSKNQSSYSTEEKVLLKDEKSPLLSQLNSESNNTSIDRVIVFFSDGSFKEYKN